LRYKTEDYENRGDAYHQQGDYGLAINDFTKALRLDPNLDQAYLGIGTAHDSKGDYDLAITDYIEVVIRDRR